MNQSAPSSPRIGSRGDATGLVDTVIATMNALEKVLGEETNLLKSGKIRSALDHEARKAELSGAYLKGLEAIKANALALARFAPESVAKLRQEHARFSQVVDLNQTVLMTVRAVSEGLMRGLASETAPRATATGYGPASLTGRRAPQSANPLAVSKQI